jgi:hypothetical protein
MNPSGIVQTGLGLKVVGIKIKIGLFFAVGSN